MIVTEEYIRDAGKFYGLDSDFSYDKGRVSVYIHPRHGANLIVDGVTWMSLSRHEIIGHLLPISLAIRNIAIAGLGLGYFVLRVMGKNDVESLDVYEIDSDVIDFFKLTFSNRDGFDKVNFIEGDVYETFKDKNYDFVYSDIYLNKYSDEIIFGAEFFSKKSLKNIYIWTQDEILFNACSRYKLIPKNSLNDKEKQIFNTGLISCMYADPSKDYCERFLKAINRL
jgi:hypothetical protein